MYKIIDGYSMYTAMNFLTKGFRNPILELFNDGSNWRKFDRTYVSMRKRRANRTVKLILADDISIERL
jgi:hypothetical protein